MANLSIKKNPRFKTHGLPDVIAMNFLNLMLQDTLIVTKHVQQAALIQIPTCEIKATSIGFKLDEEDVKYLLEVFKNPQQFREHGITFESKVYKCVRAEKQSVYAKLDKRGLVLVKTKTMLIVATFSESMLGSVCVETVEKMADYFRKKEM